MPGCRDQGVAESRELRGHLAIRRDCKIEWSEGLSPPRYITASKWQATAGAQVAAAFWKWSLLRMSEFHPLPDRDAWPTIRGYVYQVDQSILRWLDLQQDEILELERGEDIDLVLPGLAESDEELRRRLEQVKHREGNLTLRSPEALAAVASYRAYRTTNSAARLTSASRRMRWRGERSHHRCPVDGPR